MVVLLILTTLLAVALTHTVPALQHVFFILPLLAVFAVQRATSDVQRLLHVVIVCLMYGGLSGNYEFAAVFGLLSCWMLVVQHRVSLSAGIAIVLAALLMQVWFAVELQNLQPLVYGAFGVQLLAIIGLNNILRPKKERRV